MAGITRHMMAGDEIEAMVGTLAVVAVSTQSQGDDKTGRGKVGCYLPQETLHFYFGKHN